MGRISVFKSSRMRLRRPGPQVAEHSPTFHSAQTHQKVFAPLHSLHCATCLAELGLHGFPSMVPLCAIRRLRVFSPSQRVHAPQELQSLHIQSFGGSHGAVLQMPICPSTPPQGWPLFLGCCTMRRSRVRSPPPQVTVQGDHADQLPSRQSTGSP